MQRETPPMTGKPLYVLMLCTGMLAAPAAALAQSQGETQLMRSVAHELPHYAPDVDVASLSSGQIAALHVVLHSDRSQSEIRAQVRSILGGMDVLIFGRNLSFP